MQSALCAVTAFKGCISSESYGVCTPQKTGATACSYTLISAWRDSAIKLLSRLIKVLKAKVWNADMLERNTFPLRIKYKSVAGALFSSLLIQVFVQEIFTRQNKTWRAQDTHVVSWDPNASWSPIN